MKPDRKKNLSPLPAEELARGNQPRKAVAGVSGGPGVDETEPTAELAHAPIWLIIVFAVLFYWGQIYLDHNAGAFNAQVYEPFRSIDDVKNANPQSGPELVIAKGKAQYQLCIGCHQENGLGGASPPAPPLAGSEWVMAASPNRLIRIPLHGLTGPITVKGQEYALTMPPLGSGSFGTTDAEVNANLAAVLSYIRNAWGNNASIVTPEQVAAVRQETAGRPEDGPGAWTAEDLQKIPDAP